MNYKYIKCFCCGDEVNALIQKSFLSVIEHPPWFVNGNVIEYLTNTNDVIFWACDNCLKNRKAIIANIKEQKYCDNWPYLAYYDEINICDSCGEIFTFKKEEQKHWYENLKFWVQSRPKKCKKCYGNE